MKYPIHFGWRHSNRKTYPNVPAAVNVEFTEAHERQAQRNHCGQTLKHLAERGGLSPEELYAVMHGRRVLGDVEVIDPKIAVDFVLSLEVAE